MRRSRWFVVLLVVLCAGVALLGAWLRRVNAPRSVVLVTIDTLRADRLGAYGRTPSITPELDAFAARGVVFERAWTVAPLTVPAHTTLLTGLLPPLHGLRENEIESPLPRDPSRGFYLLAELFGRDGYRTAAFVSASVLRADETGLGAGFEAYDDVPRAPVGALHDSERSGEQTVEKALQWVRGIDGRFFLWVHLFEPHAPYDAPAPWGAGPSHAADAAGYDGEVACVDHAVGKLLRGLADAGAGDAVVAVVADHGESLGEHGETTHGYLLHEATLHVPMIFAAPGLIAPGRRPEAVSSVDVFPTLLALADRPIPSQAMGRPLFPVKASAQDPDRPIYAESLYPWSWCRWAQSFALRRGDEKLVVSGKRIMVFDLARDPREEHPADPDAAQRDAAARLLEVAARHPLFSPAPGPGRSVPGYESGPSGDPGTVLAPDKNAELPSPYDRMELLGAFNRAQSLFGAKQLEPALAALVDLTSRDPLNFQFAFWRGRTLELLQRHSEAAEAYRGAFEIGHRSTKCLAKALQESLRAMDASKNPEWSEGGAKAEYERARAFLDDARAKGVRDSANTYMLEACLLLVHKEFDACAEALRRAEALPHDDLVEQGIAQCRALLPK